MLALVLCGGTSILHLLKCAFGLAVILHLLIVSGHVLETEVVPIDGLHVEV